MGKVMVFRCLFDGLYSTQLDEAWKHRLQLKQQYGETVLSPAIISAYPALSHNAV